MAGHGRTGRQGGAILAVKTMADAPPTAARLRRQARSRNVLSGRADAWRLMLAGLCDAVWRVDSRGVCLEVLAPALKVIRRFPDPAPGQRLSKLLPAKAGRNVMEHVRRSIETGKANSCKLGLGIDAWVVPWTSQDVLVAIRDNCEPDRLRGELARAQARLHDVVDRLHRAREAERIRIARELHDEMGQMLAVLMMDLARMRAGLDSDNRHLDKGLAAMTKNVQTLVQSVQSIVAELRPKILEDFGLPAAVEWRDGRGASRLGVLGMQERARSLGGEASITPRSGGGTRVWVRLPVRVPAEWPFVERRRGIDRRRSRRGREPEIATTPGQEREESTMGE